jgi:bifunctional DNA-binding transcriptional regulator/antitoxin component of YhaV-PrlF toxin-antitoxin module
MTVSYTTTVIGYGNHASLEIPDTVLEKLGANKRAPLSITINGYTYRSTATGVDGKCMVVFPQKDRKGAGVQAGDKVTVLLELEVGRREVDIPAPLQAALKKSKLTATFDELSYSKRKEFARQVAEAKAEDTKERRITKIIESLKEM